MKKIIIIIALIMLVACSNTEKVNPNENSIENFSSQIHSETENYQEKNIIEPFDDRNLNTYFYEINIEVPNDWVQHTMLLKTIKYNIVSDGNSTYSQNIGFSNDVEITFAIPNSYQIVDNQNENTLGLILSNGEIDIHISNVSEFNINKYLEYKTNTRIDPMMCSRIILKNGIVDSIIYPRINHEGLNKNFSDEVQNTHKHYVEILCDGVIINFNVTEHRPEETAIISDEVYLIIKNIAGTFSVID